MDRRNRLFDFAKDHVGDILAICAGIGVVQTGRHAYKAGEMSGLDDDERISEIKKSCTYGAATIACVVGMRFTAKRREEALVAAGSALALFAQQKSDGYVGGSDEDVIELRDSGMGTPELTGFGTELFIEDFTGRRFLSDRYHVDYAIVKLSEDFKVTGHCGINDFYRYLGLPPTCAGQVLGWSIDEDDRLTEIDIEKAILDLGIFVDTYEGLGHVIKYPITPSIAYRTGIWR